VKHGVAVGVALSCAALCCARVAAAAPPRELGDGAAIVGQVRLSGLAAFAKMIGLGDLPEVRAISQRLGVDVFDPSLIAPTGIAVDQPIWATLFAVDRARTGYRHRLVVPLTDAGMFKIFLAGVAASGQTPLQPVAAASPLARLGVSATLTIPDGGTAVLRIIEQGGARVVLDSETRWRGAAPLALDVTKRAPLVPPTPFALARGASRALEDEHASLVLYADGRTTAAFAADAERLDRAGNHASYDACAKAWDKTQLSLQDAALVLSDSAGERRAEIVWGAAKRVWGIAPANADESRLDRLLDGVDAGAYADVTRLRAFSGHATGHFKTTQVFSQALAGCRFVSVVNLVLRGWPEWLALMLGHGDGALAALPLGGLAAPRVADIRQVMLGLEWPGGGAPRLSLGAVVLEPTMRERVTKLVEMLGRAPAPLTASGHQATAVTVELRPGSPMEGAFEVGAGALPLVGFFAATRAELTRLFGRLVKPGPPSPAIALARFPLSYLAALGWAEPALQKVAQTLKHALAAELVEGDGLVRLRFNVATPASR
jgi:hypothetical protein